jgi:hypothetical protein
MLINSRDSQTTQHPADTADDDTEGPGRLDFSAFRDRRAVTTLVRPATVRLSLFRVVASVNEVLCGFRITRHYPERSVQYV